MTTLPAALARPGIAGAGPRPPRKAPMTAPPIAPPHVAGLDPSLTAAAIAHADGKLYLTGQKDLTTQKHPLTWKVGKLEDLADGIVSRTLCAGLPILVVMETLPRTGTRMDPERGWLWWEVARQLTRQGVPILEVSVATIKKYATGKGNAGKPAMIEATVRRMPNLETGGDDNLCDAAWACAIGCDMLGQPQVTVPGAHRLALTKLVLPAGVRR